VVAALAARIRALPSATCLARLDAAGVPAGRVKSVREALDEERASPTTGVAPSVPGTVRMPPPALNEHGDAVRRLGWGAFGETRADS
jgi:crotonobetainyl-CoA:carnitine CoA-transferase CaiB-like acyl-CoA transferase